MRRCAHLGCETILSRYNDEDRCWLHPAPEPQSTPKPAPAWPLGLAPAMSRPASLDGIDPVDFAGTIASVYGYSYDELTAPGRRPPLVALRAVLAHYLRRRGFSLPAIGRVLGRDHSTVINMLRMPIA